MDQLNVSLQPSIPNLASGWQSLCVPLLAVMETEVQQVCLHRRIIRTEFFRHSRCKLPDFRAEAITQGFLY